MVSQSAHCVNVLSLLGLSTASPRARRKMDLPNQFGMSVMQDKRTGRKHLRREPWGKIYEEMLNQCMVGGNEQREKGMRTYENGWEL